MQTALSKCGVGGVQAPILNIRQFQWARHRYLISLWSLHFHLDHFLSAVSRIGRIKSRTSDLAVFSESHDGTSVQQPTVRIRRPPSESILQLCLKPFLYPSQKNDDAFGPRRLLRLIQSSCVSFGIYLLCVRSFTIYTLVGLRSHSLCVCYFRMRHFGNLDDRSYHILTYPGISLRKRRRIFYVAARSCLSGLIRGMKRTFWPRRISFLTRTNTFHDLYLL